MKQLTATKERRAILLAALFLVVALVTIFLESIVMDLTGDVLAVTLLLLPVVVYLIVSDRIKELRLFGGLEAKFRDTAQSSVEPAWEHVEARPAETQAAAEKGEMDLVMPPHEMDDAKPLILTLRLGGIYHPQSLLNKVYGQHGQTDGQEPLSHHRNFKFVAILDEDERMEAYLPHWRLRQILEDKNLGKKFVDLLQDRHAASIRQYPGVVTQAITTQDSNAATLQEMLDQNLEALIVVDRERRLHGVVERDQILSKLLLSLVARNEKR
jgi:hypothetical protein